MGQAVAVTPANGHGHVGNRQRRKTHASADNQVHSGPRWPGNPFHEARGHSRSYSCLTAKFVSAALTEVVSERGTAALARVSGFSVAGKTGTAQKVDPKGGYAAGEHRFLCRLHPRGGTTLRLPHHCRRRQADLRPQLWRPGGGADFFARRREGGPLPRLGARARGHGDSSCCSRAEWCYEISTVSETLLKLLDATEVIESTADPQTRVESLCYDSRQASPGALFFALRGARLDGAQFAAQAAEKGAVAIVSDVALPACAAPIRVPDGRTAMADIAAAFYAIPPASSRSWVSPGQMGRRRPLSWSSICWMLTSAVAA